MLYPDLNRAKQGNLSGTLSVVVRERRDAHTVRSKERCTMETTPTIYRSLEVIARPAALAVAILAFLIAAGFGAGALRYGAGERSACPYFRR